MKSFRKHFHVDHETDEQYANTKGWLVSIATAGAVFGCLACINLVQRLGRKNTLLLFTIIYMGGVIGMTLSKGSLSGMYASRFISGIGIGTTTILPSIYITEVGSICFSFRECPVPIGQIPTVLGRKYWHTELIQRVLIKGRTSRR